MPVAITVKIMISFGQVARRGSVEIFSKIQISVFFFFRRLYRSWLKVMRTHLKDGEAAPKLGLTSSGARGAKVREKSKVPPILFWFGIMSALPFLTKTIQKKLGL